MKSDEWVVLVSSEPHQPFLGKLLIYFLLFQNQAPSAATGRGVLLWVSNQLNGVEISKQFFHLWHQFCSGAEVIGLHVCPGVCSASQSVDMPSASPRLFTAHSKLAEVHVRNATINLAMFIVCPNSLLFLTRGTVLYWSLFPNTFEKFPPGLKHSFIFLWKPLDAFFRSATRRSDAKIKLRKLFRGKQCFCDLTKIDYFNHAIGRPG